VSSSGAVFALDAVASDRVTAGTLTPCGTSAYNVGVTRRATNAWSSVIVAIAVMLAVPVAQLRFVYVQNACCCPHEQRCHCPDHDPGKSGQGSIRPCHQAPQEIVAPALPGFVAELGADLTAPDRWVAVAIYALAAPHAPPPLRRPDAPS